MRIIPSVRIDRFAQLKSGDLFIYLNGADRCVALKGVDPTNDGDKIILLLRQATPNDAVPGPRVIGERSLTAISFGQDFILRLPSEPDGWMTSYPPEDLLCVLMAGDKAYFRGNFSQYAGDFKPCWIEVSSAVLSYKIPPGTAAFAVKWEIILQGPSAGERMILRVG